MKEGHRTSQGRNFHHLFKEGGRPCLFKMEALPPLKGGPLLCSNGIDLLYYNVLISSTTSNVVSEIQTDTPETEMGEIQLRRRWRALILGEARPPPFLKKVMGFPSLRGEGASLP